MVGECDADHGFRVLDYWARERVKNPHAKHLAVLVAEDLAGRYQTVIETLPQFLPFIGIEIRTRRLHGDGDLAVIESLVVAQPDDLILSTGDESGVESETQPRDRDWWESERSQAFSPMASQTSNGAWLVSSWNCRAESRQTTPCGTRLAAWAKL